MKKNYSINYDMKLKEIDIYKKFEILIPFIGENYNSSKQKILFIGESHFLPKESYKENSLKDLSEWYKNNQDYYNFEGNAKPCLNTRNIINNDVINLDFQNPSHSIYRNLGNVYADFFKLNGYKESLPNVAFYNYFLRPAEVEGGSIMNTKEDDIFSFNHLIQIDATLKPDAIIFASKKARQAFHRVRWSSEFRVKGEVLEEKIFYVPHPGNAWWNKEFKIAKNGFWNSKIIPFPANKINGKNKLKLILESL